ncbi:GDSL-type esterase/lipase family protein [Butyrivibrio sp. AE3004]|uniref:GDSL-type esterase/lipase family protein n=1 Tax=Butyrivibrio sp. AE3004 TaxID=1506994 RepID=UPI0006914FF2|nr:GDSL-type esterase/lipase family protein [Butyrivibrio sp. AE3004]
MKTFFQHILTMGIVVVALFFTADSALGQGYMYEKTEYSFADEPLLTQPLNRIMEGKTPYLIALAGEKLFGIKMEGPEILEESEEVLIPSNVEISSGNALEDTGVSDGNAVQDVSSGNAGEVTSGDAVAVSDGDALVVTSGNAGNEPLADTDNASFDDTTAEIVEEPVNDSYVLTSVTDDYFDDALFIGDSRTVGLSEYCPELNAHATFYAKVSLTIYGLDDKAFVSVPVLPVESDYLLTEAGDENAGAPGEGEAATTIPEDQLPKEKTTVLDALSRKQFSKIYIMLGLNELGSGTKETFTQAYAGVVNQIRALQPDAIIIIQGIMHVTNSKSNSDRVFRNSTINERNAMLSTLADGEHVFYLDMNEATDDENGGLGQDLSFDNVHLKAKSYALWYDYLKNHAYVKESELSRYTQTAEEAEVPAE